MSASKIKNLVILILLLVNVFLLILVVPTRMENIQRERQANTALTELYENAGVTLRLEDIPKTKTLYPLELSLTASDSLAAVRGLLGDRLLTQSVGRNTRYTSTSGSATLSPDGSFSAALTSAAVNDPEADARRLLDAMGLAYASLRQETSGTAKLYTAVLTVQDVPILTHSLVFRYEENSLVSVTGLLPAAAEPARSGSQSAVSARDALVAFLGSRLDTGWMGSRIESVTQGYALTYDAAQSVWRLQPSWLLATDAGTYLIDGAAKTVTAM